MTPTSDAPFIPDCYICSTETVVSSVISMQHLILYSHLPLHMKHKDVSALKENKLKLFFSLFVRMTKALTEADGLSWREKLPPIPTVPLSVREKLTQQNTVNTAKQNPEPQQNGTRQTEKPGKGIYIFYSD